jgi:hypothetical protein
MTDGITEWTGLATDLSREDLDRGFNLQLLSEILLQTCCRYSAI